MIKGAKMMGAAVLLVMAFGLINFLSRARPAPSANPDITLAERAVRSASLGASTRSQAPPRAGSRDRYRWVG
jgi:hypothetical protein